MEFGVVGLGNHAINRIIPAIARAGHSVSAVYSRSQEKAEKISAQTGAEPFTSLEKFLSHRFEAAYIASPNFLHFDHAMSCIDSGKDVLLEKPMTVLTEDAETLVRKSASSGRKLAVAFHMRFHPAIQIIRETLERGEIGNVTRISGTWGGISTSRVDTPDTRWWRIPAEAGGGSVMGTGVHVIDSIRYVTGNSPEAVFARRYPRKEIIDSTEEIMLSFSGYTAHVTSSRKMLMPDNSLYVHGDEGTIEGASIFGTEIKGKVVVNGKIVKSFRGGSPYVGEISGFVDLVNGKKSRIAMGEDGLAAVRIVNAAVLSDSEGKEVKI